MNKIPKKISLILSETPTIFLLDLSSSTALKGTPEEAVTIAANEYFDKYKEEQSIRKTNSISIQTRPVLMKTRHSEASLVVKVDRPTFISNWSMYDTYEKNDTEIETSESSNDLERLERNEKYFNAALVIERLLANNNDGMKQKLLKGLLKQEIDKEIRYNYKLEFLCTHYNDYTRNRCVTGIKFNKHNEDITAVGYGKYFFQDRYTNGALMLWNMKNPAQPEREYFFLSPVTCLEFSKISPHIIAVGFYDGSAKIIDVSQRTLNILREDSTSFEPVWDLVWYQKTAKIEVLIACFGDGKVCEFSREMDRIEIMHVTKAEGELKGLHIGRLIEGHFDSITKYVPAKCLTLHPDGRGKYLLGSSDGIVRKCKTEEIDKDGGKFRSHFGTVHSIKFSPFAKKFFMTCGDDSKICLWMEDIDEPLLVVRNSLEPVMNFDWSPSHSTILVTLQGEDICIWDFQRKMYRPQSKWKTPAGSVNTICKFSSDGKALFVGDCDGNVHVFLLSEMPFPPFFQQNAFFNSIRGILNTDERLLQKLRMCGWNRGKK